MSKASMAMEPNPRVSMAVEGNRVRRTVARFLCHEIRKVNGAETVIMQPVYSDKEGHPNKVWSKYTPSGKLEMTITNEALFGAFEPGAEYEILISPVEKQG